MWCSPLQVERYRNRVSGPLLDRIELHVEVPSVKLTDLRGAPGEVSGPVGERVGVASDSIRTTHVAEAIQYRALDRRLET